MKTVLNWLAITILVVATGTGQDSPYQQQNPGYLHDLASKGNAVALRELQVMANKGNLEAAFQLSILYLAGEGVPNDPAQSEKWCRKAAEGGHAQAQANLGTLYAWGRGGGKESCARRRLVSESG
jgi:TPR repeat protein